MSNSAPPPRAPLPPRPGPQRSHRRNRVCGRRLERVGGSGRSLNPSPRDSDLRVGPRFQRRRRPSVTSVPAAAAAAAAADSQPQALASLRSRRRQRSPDSAAAASSARPGARSWVQSLSWPPATATSSCPSSLGRAPPNPHWPTAAAAAAAARAMTVSGSPGPGRLRPAFGPALPAQAPPPRTLGLSSAAGSALSPSSALTAQSRRRPCLGVCGLLGLAACPAGRPFWGRPGGSACLRDGGGEEGGGCVLTSPSSRESLPPPTPSPLGPEPSFVFQA